MVFSANIVIKCLIAKLVYKCTLDMCMKKIGHLNANSVRKNLPEKRILIAILYCIPAKNHINVPLAIKSKLNKKTKKYFFYVKFNCYRFAIKPSLKLHLLTHTKEEPRSCHECGRAFIRKDCLLRHMRKRHRGLVDKILEDDKDDSTSEELPNSSTASLDTPTKKLSDEKLCDAIKDLLNLLLDEPTLKGFGWPESPIDEVLEAVIKRCGHSPASPEDYSYHDRLRENSKLLFTVVIDDNSVKSLLNNQTVDEVILYVLRVAKS